MPNAAGWSTTASVEITLSESDAAPPGGSPSGVSSITFSATGAQTIALTTVAGASASPPAIKSGSTSVLVLDGTSLARIAEIAVSQSPAGIAVDHTTNTIFVASLDDSSVSVLDGVRNDLIVRLVVGGRPSGVMFDETRNVAYVGNQSAGIISVIGTP